MGAEDSMCVELSLKENVIPPMVLAIASKQNDKEMLRRNEGALLSLWIQFSTI